MSAADARPVKLEKLGAKSHVTGLQVGLDCLTRVFQSCFDSFALRHAAGQLRHVGDVAVILRVEDQVYEETLFVSHEGILTRQGGASQRP